MGGRGRWGVTIGVGWRGVEAMAFGGGGCGGETRQGGWRCDMGCGVRWRY